MAYMYICMYIVHVRVCYTCTCTYMPVSTGASLLQPPLLCPHSRSLHSSPGSVPQLIERSGAIVTLPSDHRLPLAYYLTQQDVNYLKR